MPARRIPFPAWLRMPEPSEGTAPKRSQQEKFCCDGCIHFPPATWENWSICCAGIRMQFFMPDAYGFVDDCGYSPAKRPCPCFEAKHDEQ